MSSSDVDAHLARFAGEQADALAKTRALIARALPGAQESISYGMPTFKVDGIAVVGFDGFSKHNSLFPYSGQVPALVARTHPDWVAAKGTIHFPLDQVFPGTLLKQILTLRIDEINAGFPRSNGTTKEFYDNGRLKLSGKIRSGEMHGQWKWWRRDGSLMRSGAFKDGRQVGAWTTYDRAEHVVKSTEFGK